MEHRIGIALSGGGVRGVAHVGVLEALKENGIEPDCIAGNSAGAIVGALYAAGYSADESLEFFKAKSPFRLSRVTLRKAGFIDTDKVVSDLREYFPDDSFETLSKELFVTATDLVNARLEIFTSGPLIPAILASSSMPMVFTPTEIDGRWFSDGGILNNFPVEPLKVLCDSIIGVYASPLRTTGHEDLKSFLAVSYRAFEVGMYFASRRKFHDCDVLLCPEALTRFGVFDTKSIQEIFEIGYKETLDRIDLISRTLDSVRV
jgi:NTE family protein